MQSGLLYWRDFQLIPATTGFIGVGDHQLDLKPVTDEPFQCRASEVRRATKNELHVAACVLLNDRASDAAPRRRVTPRSPFSSLRELANLALDRFSLERAEMMDEKYSIQ